MKRPASSTSCIWMMLALASLTGALAQTRRAPLSSRAILEAGIPAPAKGEFLGPSTYATGQSPNSITVADFNGDGNMDLAVPNFSSNTVSVLMGSGDGTFRARTDFATGVAPSSVAVGDFNEDGKLDMAVANATNTLSVLLGNGDGTFQSHVDYPAGSGPISVAAADFNRDGKLDLAVANDLGNTVSIFFGNGDGTFQPGVEYASGTAPGSVVVADLNRDGTPDLVVTNYRDNTVSVLLGDRDGTFQPHMDYTTGFSPLSVAVGDLNGDDKLDLAVANQGSSTVSVLLGKGDGTFQSHVDYASGVGISITSSVVIGDFNGDGKPDLATGNIGNDTGNASVSVLLGNGSGIFPLPVNYHAGSYPFSVAAADFNHDGAVDLVAGDFERAAVDVLMNLGGTHLTLTSSENPSVLGQPVTLTVTVAAVFGQSRTPAGSIAFKDGTHALGSVSMVHGKARLTTSDLQTGIHKIEALYSGDSAFNPNQAPAILQKVLK